ncbi:MAG: hypothetical protein ACR2JC_03325 [Chloroflexota bacterium]|nr:MAG: hypothetical protein DLM71_07120 [Chloroflexota bacterium]
MSVKFRLSGFYNGVNTFKAAFPQLSDALIEWRERSGPDDGSATELRKTGFRRGNFTQGVVPCSNAVCHEGGYELDKLIADMLRTGETEREGQLLCVGREVSEEGRRGPLRCRQRIEFKATLIPKADDEQDRLDRPDRSSQRRRSRGRGPRRNSAA